MSRLDLHAITLKLCSHQNSFCGCSPCRVVPDPIRGGDNVLIMCEVLNPDGTPHESNTRAQLRELLTPDVVAQECLYGFEQVRAYRIQIYPGL